MRHVIHKKHFTVMQTNKNITNVAAGKSGLH